VLYNASTFPGSSGSAILDPNSDFAVLALHHAAFITASNIGQRNRGVLMASVAAHMDQEQIMKVPDKTAVELWSPQVCNCLCLFINFTLIVMQELHVFLASVPGLQRVAPFLSEVHFYFQAFESDL
jgi:hypothetical protein